MEQRFRPLLTGTWIVAGKRFQVCNVMHRTAREWSLRRYAVPALE
jgi:hypothetical protein